MKHTSTVLVAGVVLAACTEHPDPVGVVPGDLEVPAAETSTIIATPLPSPLIPLEDVLGRVLGGLPQDAAADELRAALAELASGLHGNDGCLLVPHYRAAETALRRMQSGAPAEVGPELTAIELALGSVEPSLPRWCER